MKKLIKWILCFMKSHKWSIPSKVYYFTDTGELKQKRQQHCYRCYKCRDSINE